MQRDSDADARLDYINAQNQIAGVDSYQKPILFDPSELDSDKDKLAEILNSDELAAKAMPFVEQMVERAAMQSYGAAVSQMGAYFTQGNAEVNKWGFIFAAGFDAAEGRSMEEVAKEIGVTRAAISKAAGEWIKRLNLPRSRYMRSESTQDAYAERAKTTHHDKHNDETDKDAIPADIKAPKCKLTRTSLEMAEDATEADYQQTIQALAQCNEALQWWVGDWLVQAGKKYAETYEGWVKGLGWSYGTLRNLKNISANVEMSRRRDNLTFNHHVEVAALPTHEQEHWLAWAATPDYLPPHAREGDKPTVKPTRLLRESIKAGKPLTEMPSHVAIPGDTIEQWCGLPMRSWYSRTFRRLLPIASKERLEKWAEKLRTPARMYEQVMERLNQ